jgi:hypothetical protein
VNPLTPYIIGAAVVLEIAPVLSWWHLGPNRFPLIVYVVGVTVAWAAVLGIAWLTGGRAVQYLPLGLRRIRPRDARHVRRCARLSILRPDHG